MNNEHKEALQQLLQGANVNIHQLVVGDSTQTIENLIMGDLRKTTTAAATMSHALLMTMRR